MDKGNKIVQTQLKDGTIVKFEATNMGGEENVSSSKKLFSFDEVSGSIEGIAKSLVETFKKVAPDKASIEFGVEIAVESGNLTALIVKGAATGNLKVTLEWSKKPE